MCHKHCNYVRVGLLGFAPVSRVGRVICYVCLWGSWGRRFAIKSNLENYESVSYINWS